MVAEPAASALHLFVSEQDAADERRRVRVERARAQSRCGSCGRFARREGLSFGAVCDGCIRSDHSAIVHKVDQARRWWLATKTLP